MCVHKEFGVSKLILQADGPIIIIFTLQICMVLLQQVFSLLARKLSKVLDHCKMIMIHLWFTFYWVLLSEGIWLSSWYWPNVVRSKNPIKAILPLILLFVTLGTMIYPSA